MNSRRMMWGVAGLVMMTVMACRPGADTAQGTSDRFVDAYYVQIDLATAATFCSGPALEKLQQEQKLVEGQVIDQGTEKPQVNYELAEKRDESAESVAFVYNGTIRAEGAEPFTRKWMVTTRHDGTGWHVVTFSEFGVTAGGEP